MTRAARILGRALGAALALAALVLAFSAFVVATPSGRSLAAWAADRWVEGLSIGSIEGGWRDLRVRDVAWRSPGVAVRADALELSFDWRRLADREVSADRLGLDGVEVTLEPDEMPASESAPADPDAPLIPDLTLPDAVRRVRLGVLELKRVRFRMPGLDAGLGALEAGVSLEGGRLALSALRTKSLSVVTPQVSVRSDAIDAAASLSGGESAGAVIERLALAGGEVTLREAGESKTDEANEVVEASQPSERSEPDLPGQPGQPAPSGKLSESPDDAAEPSAADAAGDAPGDAVAAESRAPRADAFVKRIEALFAEPFIKSLPEVRVPVAVRIGGLDVSDWRVAGIPGAGSLPGLAPLSIESLHAEASLRDDAADLTEFSFRSSAANLEARASARMSGSWPLDASLRLEADALPWLGVAGLAVETGLSQAARETSLSLMLRGSVVGRLDASASLTGAAPLELVAHADPSKAELPFGLTLSSPELVAPSAIPADSFSASFSSAAEKTDQAAQASESQKSEKTAARAASAGDAAASLPERYVLRDLLLEVSGRPSEWSLTLSGKPEMTAPEALASVRKTLEGVFEASASGSLSRMELSHLAMDTPFGHLEAKGAADWSEHIAWRGEAKALGVDVGAWVKRLPLKVEAAVSGSGLVREDGSFRIDPSKVAIDGTIQKAPVRLHAVFSGEDGTSWRVPELDLLLGRNTLKLSGGVERLRGVDIDLAVKAPGLLNTIPGLRGRAEGTVKLGGSLAHPIAQADLTASDLGWEDAFALKSLRLLMDLRNSPFKSTDAGGKAPPPPPVTEADVAAAGERIEPPPPPPLHSDSPSGRPSAAPPPAGASAADKFAFIVNSLADGEIVGSLNFSATGITTPGATIDAVRAAVKGTEAAHSVSVSVTGEPVSASVALSGAFSRETLGWKGELARASVKTPAGEWRSRGKASLEWDSARTRFIAGEHCWIHENAEACLSKPLVAGEAGEAHVKLVRLDLGVLKPYLRKKSDRITGALTGGLDASWDLAKRPMPSVSLDLNGDGLTYSTRWEGVRIPITLERLRAHAMAGDRRVAFAWEIKPAGNGSSSGQLAVVDPMKARRLEGVIRLDGVTPSFIEPFLSRGEKAQGELWANLRAGGTLEAPELTGRAAVEDVVVAADFVPFEMEPSGIVVDFLGKRSVLSGRLRTRTGSAEFSGEAAWENVKRWTAGVVVATEGLHLAVQSLAEIDVKGRVEADATPEKVRLAGEIEIPKSSIEIKELPVSAVSLSDDQVLLDANLEPLSVRTESLPVESDVTVRLGEDVRIAAYGLRAKLSGSVKLLMGRGRTGLVGQINIPEGRFRAYGQDLIVQSGQILFSGSMDNPGLRIEAVRNPENTADDVTAGIRVSGTAEAPQVQLFSTPQLPEQETLSYLLRGEGLGSDEGSSSAMMTSMLIGIGTSQSGGILSEAGDAVGLRGLGVDTTGTGDEQKVVVSAYVLPGLQVKYGVGIFDSLATLTLRYRLMPKLYLEAVSGVNQALDLLYRFEW